MEQNKKNKLVYLIFSIGFMLLFIPTMLFALSDHRDKTPFFGLEEGYVQAIVFLWAILGSMMFAIICPRIFSLLYIKVKVLTLRNYENGFIETEKPEFSLKKYLWRATYATLLSIGLMLVLTEVGLIDLDIFRAIGEEYDPYSMGDFQISIAIFFPIAVALFSIGWAIEDAGLIHYNLPDDQTNRLFEIEPIHVRYNSYIKGYAGISSLFYYISFVSYFIVFSPESLLGGGVGILLVLFGYWAYLFPTYLIYLKISKNFLKKNLIQYEGMTKRDLKRVKKQDT